MIPSAWRWHAHTPLSLLLALHVLVLLLITCHVTAIVSARTADGTCDFRAHHPRRYAVHHLKPSRLGASALRRSVTAREAKDATVTIDGLLNETAWEETPWSDDFVDIRGARHWSQPWFATRVKLRFDDAFLYVGAFLEETAVWANVTARNDVVFADNDFEVFVDADGSTHNYKEVEVNAVNTTWNLWLDRPYRDGGHENSTRVDPAFGFDMVRNGMATAVYMKGAPNRGTEQLHFWTVEIALPLVELARYTRAHVPPAHMTFWRINFSRVEWSVASRDNGARFEKIPGEREDNWVWSPQFAVDMHMPEHWGYLQFRTDAIDVFATDVPLDPEWNVRYVSFELYYAQHAFEDAHGAYATTLAALEPYFRSAAAFACLDLQHLAVDNVARTFRASVMCRGDANYVASIQHDSYVTVQRVSNDVSSVA